MSCADLTQHVICYSQCYNFVTIVVSTVSLFNKVTYKKVVIDLFTAMCLCVCLHVSLKLLSIVLCFIMGDQFDEHVASLVACNRHHHRVTLICNLTCFCLWLIKYDNGDDDGIGWRNICGCCDVVMFVTMATVRGNSCGFLSFLYEVALPLPRTSPEACLTGWPNARPHGGTSVTRHHQPCLTLCVKCRCCATFIFLSERCVYKG